MSETDQNQARKKNLSFQADPLEREAFEDEYISRFGSHFSVQFHPSLRSGGVRMVGMGPQNTSVPLYLGVECENQRWGFPVGYPAPFNRPEKTIQDFRISRTMNSLTATSNEEHMGLEISFRWVSPFFPRDEVLSTAPFFYLEACVKNPSHHTREGWIYGGLEKLTQTRRMGKDTLVQTVDIAASFRGPEFKPGKLLRYDLALFCPDAEMQRKTLSSGSAFWDMDAIPFQLQPGEERRVLFILASFLLERGIVRVHGIPCDFSYQQRFANVGEVVEYAVQNKASILQKSDLFDSLLLQADIPQRIQDFICWNFHIYQGATWYLHHPDGRDFYTCYEGGTGYFSTIDVEYNLAPFYALFWPQLIRDQLDLWAQTYEKGNRERPFSFGPDVCIMPHDIGGGFEIDEQVYILGPMPVEENANFLLLHALYAHFTGNREPFENQKELCIALGDFILGSDLSGNGLPDTGTNNTLDCFESLYRDMEDQVFLGIKAATALDFLSRMLQSTGEPPERYQRFRAFAQKAFHTIETRAWKEDHYVVTLSARQPQGWDASSPLTTNGMAYLFFCGQQVPLCRKRLETDLALSRESYSMWPSMGVWRDMVGCYLGNEPAGHYRFRPDFRGDMYPRSANTLGMLLAYPGMGVSFLEKRISVGMAHPGRFPLLPLADWQNGWVPWIRIQEGELHLEFPEEASDDFRQRVASFAIRFFNGDNPSSERGETPCP